MRPGLARICPPPPVQADWGHAGHHGTTQSPFSTPMRCLDLTLDTPAENLALDEALLLEAEEGSGGEILRFWTSPVPFVVVGIGARVQEEVFQDACQDDDVPVLRRCSGGGTVLQGPGCLSYALILRIRSDAPTATITGTNRFVMQRNADALAALLDKPVTVEGHTDLAVDGLKVSGNSQRRLRNHLLFHGTFLLGMGSAMITRLLRQPHREPAYRAGRPHEAFVADLNVSGAAVKEALFRAWQTCGALEERRIRQLNGRVSALVARSYGNDQWNLRS